VGLAGGGAAATGVVGAAMLWWLRDKSVGHHAVVVGLVSVAATAAGVLLACRAMFVSEHDGAVLFVVLAAAGTVGVLAALALSARLATASRSLEHMARGIGEASAAAPSQAPATEELASVARQLQETSARLARSAARERA